MTKLVRRDPFRSLFAWPRWFDEFEDFGGQRGLKIRETDSDIIAEAVIAGVATKDVDIDIEDGVLTIRAESKKETEEEKSSYQYYYTAALSGGQWDKVEAKVRDGVVRITIPKAESVKPRKIKVSEGE